MRSAYCVRYNSQVYNNKAFHGRRLGNVIHINNNTTAKLVQYFNEFEILPKMQSAVGSRHSAPQTNPFNRANSLRLFLMFVHESLNSVLSIYVFNTQSISDAINLFSSIVIHYCISHFGVCD